MPSGGWLRRRRRDTERDGWGRDGLNSPERYLFFISAPLSVGGILFSGGESGEPTGIEWQREHVRRSGPSRLRR